VQITHRNFTTFISSLVHIGIFNNTDIVVQIAACTFDAHVLEILVALLLSATVIILHPYGNMDSTYLIPTMEKKQVTYILAVPAFLNELCDFIKKRKMPRLGSIRSCCLGGQ
jgi:non-ribosomal peptide synthetase component F